MPLQEPFSPPEAAKAHETFEKGASANEGVRFSMQFKGLPENRLQERNNKKATHRLLFSAFRRIGCRREKTNRMQERNNTNSSKPV